MLESRSEDALVLLVKLVKSTIMTVETRDGHAYAAMSDSCRMMRICAYAYACRQKKSDVAKREK